MRIVSALAFLAIAACPSRGPSLDDEFRSARKLLVREQYNLALPIAERALARAERTANQSEAWRFRLLKADIVIGQRQSAKTLALLDSYGNTPNGSEWAEVRAHALLLRGRALYGLNRFRQSKEFLGRASEDAKQAGSESLSAEILLRQGFVLVLQSKFAEGRTDFQSVAQTAHRLHDVYQEASAVGNIGFALLSESRNDEAIPWFDRAIQLFTKIDARDSVARTHGNLGNCYLRLGDYDSAGLEYNRAQEWFAKTGSLENQQIWIGNAANVSYELADYATADAGYNRALAMAREVSSPVWIARWLNSLASSSLALGKWDAAESYNNEALQKMRDLQDSGYEPTALVNAARIAAGRGHFDRARGLFHEALSKRAEDPVTDLDAHAGLAGTFVREGRPREAEAEFRNTVGLVEERGRKLLKNEYKLTYLSSLIEFYRGYVDFLIANHQPERALEVAESSRSHVLQEKSGGSEPGRQFSAHDYRKLARDTKSVVLEYWLSPSKSYLWAIGPDSIQLHELPDEQSIQKLVEGYRAVITAGRNPLDAASDTGRKLADALLPAMNPGGRFIVVPDGPLASFPLETLPAPGDPKKFWIEQSTVALTPSLNYLAIQTSARAAHPDMQLLLIGDPSSSSPQYPHLEFASREIDSIASAMHSPKTAIFRGESATPGSYRNAQPGQFEFVHFAAHAAANPQSPLDSAVILSGPDDANRLLARDVAAIPLGAQLVTISACRSAGGRTYAGEGLVGFAWAFLRAGARNVIAGFWDVSDRSTSQLMASLYSGIAAGKQPLEALRSAKLELIHAGGAYEKPLYWAPFQLYLGTARLSDPALTASTRY
jgi:CHAT domain-containing protein/Tfp pilus assembly protein PilF